MLTRAIIEHNQPYNTQDTYKTLDQTDALVVCMQANIHNAEKISRSGGRTISPLNISDKYTRNLRNCQAIIMLGEDNMDEEIISSMSHQAPDAIGYLEDNTYILNDDGEKLVEKIKEHLTLLQQDSDDIHIYLAAGSVVDKEQQEIYIASKIFREDFFKNHNHNLQSFDPTKVNTTRGLYLHHESKQLIEIGPNN